MSVFRGDKPLVEVVVLLMAAALALPAAAHAQTPVPADGTYVVDVDMQGGTGRASVDSPTELTVADGRMTASVTWSSPNYDLMTVDGVDYRPVNTSGNSAFRIPVAELDADLAVQAETTAMSRPHTIEYVLRFSNVRREGPSPAVVAAVVAAVAVAIAGVVLVRRRKAGDAR